MTKEQEEIEILKEFKDKGYAKLYIKYNGNRPEINLKIKNSIETVLSMLEEKNKVIDLMAEELTTPMHSKEWVKQYYENKAKE